MYNKNINKALLGLVITMSAANLSFAGCEDKICDNCCDAKGGIRYCDSSAGRYVCNSGDYSACYCTIHAVMDMQKFAGCCMWQGGVLKVSEEGIVMCRNGGNSEICSTKY